MKRTQIQLNEDTYEALREKAHEERKSISEIIRNIVGKELEKRGKQKGFAKNKSVDDFDFIGAIEGGPKDLARNHDKYFTGSK